MNTDAIKDLIRAGLEMNPMDLEYALACRAKTVLTALEAENVELRKALKGAWSLIVRHHASHVTRTPPGLLCPVCMNGAEETPEFVRIKALIGEEGEVMLDDPNDSEWHRARNVR